MMALRTSGAVMGVRSLPLSRVASSASRRTIHRTMAPVHASANVSMNLDFLVSPCLLLFESHSATW